MFHTILNFSNDKILQFQTEEPCHIRLFITKFSIIEQYILNQVFIRFILKQYTKLVRNIVKQECANNSTFSNPLELLG